MAQIYRTRDGDTVDLVVWRQYNRQDQQIIDLMLEANPTLADFGAILPAGIQIKLPIVQTSEIVESVRLWD